VLFIGIQPKGVLNLIPEIGPFPEKGGCNFRKKNRGKRGSLFVEPSQKGWGHGRKPISPHLLMGSRPKTGGRKKTAEIKGGAPGKSKIVEGIRRIFIKRLRGETIYH